MSGHRVWRFAVPGAALSAALSILLWGGVQQVAEGRPGDAAELAVGGASPARAHPAPQELGGAPPNTRRLAQALDGFWRQNLDDAAGEPVDAAPPPVLAEASAAPAGGPRVPSVEVLRQEVEANPHGAPPSLITFALDAHAQLQLALASEVEALRQLERIEAAFAASEAPPEVVQAVLLEQARELAGRYSALEPRCIALWREAPERVLALVF